MTITNKEKDQKTKTTLPGFEKFWETWPDNSPTYTRKVNRANCFRKWSRQGLEKIAEQVIFAVVRCKASRDWMKNAGEFIPQPETWLNQRRWESTPVNGSAKPHNPFASLK